MKKHYIPILMYHSIETKPKGSILRSLSVPPKLFNSQMRILNFLGYKGLSMSALKPYLEGKKTGKVFGITFDDGYQNILLNALPILKKYNFSATTYIVSDLIGNYNLWDEEIGIDKMKLMNIEEIHSWLRSGMEIGSHSMTHGNLTKLDTAQARKEISYSKNKLEKIFSVQVNHFCYPYGKFNDMSSENVEISGYHTATTVRRGRAEPTMDIFKLPRIFVTHRTYMYQLLLKFFTNYENSRNR